MTVYEYIVVPAPRKGRKGKGIKGAAARFSFALQELMNAYAANGWEFQRAETLPSVERSGLASSTTVYRDLLVFRRVRTPLSEPVNPMVFQEHLDDIAQDDPTDLDPETEAEEIEADVEDDTPEPDAEPDTAPDTRARDEQNLTPPG